MATPAKRATRASTRKAAKSTEETLVDNSEEILENENQEEEADSSSDGDDVNDGDDNNAGDEDESEEEEEEQSDKEDSSEEGDGDEQVRVKFTTRFSKYRVTDTSIAVPVSLRRSGLSEVVNHLLGNAPENRVVFDFLVVDKDTLIRKSLEFHIRDLKLSLEDVLHLEYAPALMEPELSAEDKWPDWLSCVDGRRDVLNEDGNVSATIAVAGSYDGSITFCELAKSAKVNEFQNLAKVQAHKAAVKAVVQFGDNLLASSGKDGLVKLWSATHSSSGETSTLNCSQIANCEGHQRSVEAVDGVQIGEFAVLGSGGWDNAACLWKVALNDDASEAPEEEDDSMGRKKRKGIRGKATTALKTVTPAAVFQGHTDNVSAVAWAGRDAPSSLFTGSWDRSIRAWDVVREVCTIKLNGNKVVTSISHNAMSNLVATGHADHQVRLWDSRVTGEAIVKLSLKSHEAWVTSVQWCPTNANLLATASQDRTIKLWDVRSTIPLYTLKQHSNKVFGVSWDATGSLLWSAGADSMLRAFRFSQDEE